MSWGGSRKAALVGTAVLVAGGGVAFAISGSGDGEDTKRTARASGSATSTSTPTAASGAEACPVPVVRQVMLAKSWMYVDMEKGIRTTGVYAVGSLDRAEQDTDLAFADSPRSLKADWDVFRRALIKYNSDARPLVDRSSIDNPNEGSETRPVVDQLWTQGEPSFRRLRDALREACRGKFDVRELDR